MPAVKQAPAGGASPYNRQMTHTNILRLQNADCVVEVLPDLGGTILRFEWRGIPVLRPSDGVPAIPRLTSCYPLAPFSNRIAGARLAFGGNTWPVAQTVDYEPLPMHGLAWQRPWQVDSRDDAHIVLTQEYVPPATNAPWPFPYRLRQAFSLLDDGLHMALALRNTGNAPQPAGLGWHPYFPRTPATRVWAQVGDMWVSDEAHLPVSLQSPPAGLATGLLVADTDFDNAFRDFKGRARVEWPERKLAVNVRADAALSHMVLFTPPAKLHLAVEPVTHMTDAFNRYAAAGGAAVAGVDDATGTVVLAPGATLEVAMALLPQPLA
jgi:aldose 1-epimerase